MRALVIDDEQLVLEGLEALLQVSLPDISLDKTAALDTALRLAASVDYEVVLLGWNLVAGDGWRVDARGVIDALRASRSPALVEVIAGDESLGLPRRLLDLVLSGFVPKSALGAVLLDAIGVACRGGVYLPARVAQPQRPGLTRPPREAPAVFVTGDTAPERLTEMARAGVPVLHKPVQGERLMRVILEQVRAGAT